MNATRSFFFDRQNRDFAWNVMDSIIVFMAVLDCWVLQGTDDIRAISALRLIRLSERAEGVAERGPAR